MGISKARIFHKGINEQIPRISRKDAIKQVVNFLENNDIKNSINLVTMFGLSAEEVLEAGASYEAVYAIKIY